LDAELLRKIEVACQLVDNDNELLLHSRWACEALLDELSWSDFTPAETVSLCIILARANARRLAACPPFPGLRIAG
jgi:hypothetical protein